jgi:tetrahydromethanopterin S-methyltransferase subunit C
MKRAIAILLLACSATSFTLIFTHWHGVVGSAFLGMVGLILLVSSLRFLNAKLDSPEPTMPTAMRTGRLVIVTSLSSLIAVLQTLMMHEYRSQVLGLIVTALCWIWAFRNIAKLFGFTYRSESRTYDGRITTTDDSSE